MNKSRFMVLYIISKLFIAKFIIAKWAAQVIIYGFCNRICEIKYQILNNLINSSTELM